MLVHGVICAISMTILDGSLRQSVGRTMTLLRTEVEAGKFENHLTDEI